MKVSICIPMFNESQIIEQTAKTVSDYCDKNINDYEIIFVDDGSKDDCCDIVQNLGLSNCRVIRYQTNKGKGYAVRTGMLAATGDIRIFTDADLAYGTNVIKDAIKKIQDFPDIDIVIGSRKAAEDGYQGYTWIRKITSRVYLWLLNRLGHFTLSDSQVGFKCFTGNAASQVFGLCETNDFSFDFEILCYATRLGMKIEEMPVRVINHRDSTVHLFRDSIRMFADIFIISRRALKKIPKRTSCLHQP